MARKHVILFVCGALALVAAAACSTGSSSSKDKYVGGKWLVRDPAAQTNGFDIVFNEDGTFVGYHIPDAPSVVKIRGPYELDGENVKGRFTATSGGRIGRIEASLESGGTILVFDFIEENAFGSPGAVNGVKHWLLRGPNPTKK